MLVHGLVLGTKITWQPLQKKARSKSKLLISCSISHNWLCASANDGLQLRISWPEDPNIYIYIICHVLTFYFLDSSSTAPKKSLCQETAALCCRALCSQGCKTSVWSSGWLVWSWGHGSVAGLLDGTLPSFPFGIVGAHRNCQISSIAIHNLHLDKVTLIHSRPLGVSKTHIYNKNQCTDPTWPHLNSGPVIFCFAVRGQPCNSEPPGGFPKACLQFLQLRLSLGQMFFSDKSWLMGLWNYNSPLFACMSFSPKCKSIFLGRVVPFWYLVQDSLE